VITTRSFKFAAQNVAFAFLFYAPFMLVSQENILSVIPQRSPIVMVDTLLHCDGTTTKTGFRVRDSNIFHENDFLRESGLVENIAQTAAAGAGFTARQMGQPAPVGYIGAIQNLQIFALPKTGDLLETEVILAHKVFDVSFINGSIRCGDLLIAKCEMKIFISKQS
jgi:predicted hotdog family 3-hydroxylacyl-ACP dehydratase